MATRSKKPKTGINRFARPQLSHRTVQGRQVVTVEWKGRMVEVIAGRFALKRKDRPSQSTDNLEMLLTQAITRPDRRCRRNIEIIQLDPQMDLENLTKTLASIVEKNGDIEWIEPVTVTHGSSAPNDERYPEQWGLRAIRFEQATSHASGNVNRVVLAIMDTGIPLLAGNLSHPDLAGDQRFFIGPDLVSDDDDPSDDHGHGTHITGIAAANTNNKLGVAGLWRGPVYVIKVLDAHNQGMSDDFAEGISNAIQFAQDRQARLVVNYSGRVVDDMHVRDAIEELSESNGMLVAAAGNNFGFSVDYPAAYSLEFSNVVAVGAVNKQLKHPDFASRGPEITVVAPGVDILSTLPNYHVTLNNTENQKSLKYDTLNGTSQAAAFVSALSALVWTKWPQLTAHQVRERLSETTTPIAGPPEDFGSGLINMERALA